MVAAAGAGEAVAVEETPMLGTERPGTLELMRVDLLLVSVPFSERSEAAV